MIRLNGIVAGAVALCMVSAAGAATLTGAYSSSLTQPVALDVVGWNIGPLNSLTTRSFNWNRSDLPAGAGVDNTIPASFVGYCIEINQSVAAGSSTTYNVLSGAGAGLSANEVLLLSRLWGEYQDDIVDGVTSAAFQCAIYEITYDADTVGLNTGTGDFKIQPTFGNIAIATQLSIWLAGIQNVAAAQAPIAILQSQTAQDQIVRVPAPTTATVGLLSAGLVARRRRRN